MKKETKKKSKVEEKPEKKKAKKNLNKNNLEKEIKEGSGIAEMADVFEKSTRTIYNKIKEFGLSKIWEETKAPDHDLIKNINRNSALHLSIYLNKKVRDNKFLFPSEINFIVTMNKSDGLLNPNNTDNGIIDQIQKELEEARKELNIKDDDESELFSNEESNTFFDDEEEEEQEDI